MITPTDSISQAPQANSSPAQTSNSVALGRNGLPLRLLPTGAARLQAVMETVQAHAPESASEGAAQAPQSDAQELPTVPNRPPYTTEIRVVVVIDAYDGVPQHETRNGLHEYAEARIVNVLAVAHPENFDANDPRIHLAMNVASAEDSAGLPREIPLQPGQQLEVQGEYIPADHAHGGGPAVLHFTHSPAGYVTINGQTYA
ncbi:hypothetical protein SAMN05444354_101167 [Stigmatella aurantiaca]|uniref:Uncharacterized protein n=2 Tax=Stigmatella aurantiaca TaxID=41 RepID=A0A1H7FNR4_STIAU|nr:hypothetical protein SAMN05444354_101167 [Stigmatella aurantiaca]